MIYAIVFFFWKILIKWKWFKYIILLFAYSYAHKFVTYSITKQGSHIKIYFKLFNTKLDLSQTGRERLSIESEWTWLFILININFNWLYYPIIFKFTSIMYEIDEAWMMIPILYNLLHVLFARYWPSVAFISNRYLNLLFLCEIYYSISYLPNALWFKISTPRFLKSPWEWF